MKKKNLKQRLSDLYKERDRLINHLDDIPGSPYTIMELLDIEFQIGAIEDALAFEKMLRPFKISLYVFIAFSVGLLIFSLFK
jgi:hypothetical protein